MYKTRVTFAKYAYPSHPPFSPTCCSARFTVIRFFGSSTNICRIKSNFCKLRSPRLPQLTSRCRTVRYIFRTPWVYLHHRLHTVLHHPPLHRADAVGSQRHRVTLPFRQLPLLLIPAGILRGGNEDARITAARSRRIGDGRKSSPAS